jgi:tetratricopeptide (TPR) repeat protein
MRSKELGMDDDLDNYYISVIPEDGGADTVFSSRKEANDAMQEGEAAFARGDYATARTSYIKAMISDPTSYEAVLYIGDTYFSEKQYDPACEWFSRAMQINPDRETAYRYWGDALMRLEKINEARSKYIDAVIAQPYNAKSWIWLKSWAEGIKAQLNMPDFKMPPKPQLTTKDSGDQKIMLDAESLKSQDKKDGTGHWMAYSIASGAWRMKLFKEKFPNEKEYRRTLLEENACLEVVAKLVDEDIKNGKLENRNLDSGIAVLLRIYRANLLEPYILLILKDAGIARDYAPYREKIVTS